MRTPEIFIRAADWAHARDFGCPAGIGLRRVLLELTGPPRVGACTLHAPVPLPASWQVREVVVSWPATSPGVDIVVLVHPDPLPAAARSRIALGLQEVIVVRQLPEEPPFPAGLLPAVRSRLLHGEIRALAARHPRLADELLALAGPAPTITRTPRVAVISPDPDTRVELPGIDIADDAHVDAVLAVAPPGGWTTADHPTLADAARRAGRLVSTAPLPAGIPGTLVPPGRPPVEAVRHALTLPADPLPDARPGTWLRAAEQLERRRRVLLDTHLTDLVTRRAVGELAQLAHEQGLPPSSPPRLREQLGQALLMAFVVGLAACRAVWAAGPLAAATAGMLAALAAGGLRWWRGRREAQSRWAAEEAARLRRAPEHAPAVWLRRTLAKELT
ncbi:hypothetical protein EAH68_03650 [Corynebacterium hylobatis]|uniref:Uncharacterized protein n=1 Tax=Corynebacterium hylobatis TaxID=1859290 RepID=A0A3R9ZFA7_9CORY|nr:hypothetical protein [Corynebacterium hylobatis]RSZ64705.1 hypothetical protein EAH68_03650 [Corynebacterium hylobatis]